MILNISNLLCCNSVLCLAFAFTPFKRLKFKFCCRSKEFSKLVSPATQAQAFFFTKDASLTQFCYLGIPWYWNWGTTWFEPQKVCSTITLEDLKFYCALFKKKTLKEQDSFEEKSIQNWTFLFCNLKTFYFARHFGIQSTQNHWVLSGSIYLATLSPEEQARLH